ncbi:cAMP-dependent protein kinase inhibitor beta isoform 1-T1 [Spinachia spinachia]
MDFDRLRSQKYQWQRPVWRGVAEMTEVEPVLDFASSGRSGRRNALPDILGSPAGVNPADLPLKLAEMSLTDGPAGAQSPTAEGPPVPPESSEGKEGS